MCCRHALVVCVWPQCVCVCVLKCHVCLADYCQGNPCATVLNSTGVCTNYPWPQTGYSCGCTSEPRLFGWNKETQRCERKSEI